LRRRPRLRRLLLWLRLLLLLLRLLLRLPVLLRLDHSRLEVFVYHTGTMHDEYTRQAKASADHWTEAVSLTDRALHQANAA
jgi:predicted O-linked N-acetylglucosamine transferase (SPINDLY family)